MIRQLRRLVLALAVACLPFAARAQVAMNLSSPQQTIDGYGFAGSIFGDNGTSNEGGWSDAALDLLCSPSKGIGGNIIRVGIANSGDGTGGFWQDANPGHQNTMSDAKKCKLRNPALKVIAAPWSPPTACKSSGSISTGSCTSACCGASPSDTQWVTWISNAVDEAHRTGIDFYCISPQNEPDFDPVGTHEGCTFTATAWRDFANALGPVLSAKSPSVPLCGPDVGQWSNMWSGTDYVDTCIADTTCKAQISSVWITHQYEPAVAVTPGALNSKRLWMTEYSRLDSNNTGMTGNGGGLALGQLISDAHTTGQVSGWLAWWGVTSHTSNDDGLLEFGDVQTKRLWVLGNWSKFVLPGMVRFGITGSPPANVSVSTYKDPTSNNVAVVAVNNQASTAALTVTLDAASKVQVVTPWLTDATHNLVGQTPVVVLGHAFTFTLPANSVVTFAGNGT